MAFFKKLFSKMRNPKETVGKQESLFIRQKDKIYPWIKTISHDGERTDTSVVLELNNADEPIYRRWLADLAIFYAVDMGDNFQLLQARDLPTGVSHEQLHQVAIENLRRDVEFELKSTNFGGYGLMAGGDHEASSILLTEKWEWLANYLDDNLIVAIPAKDLVLIVPSGSQDGISNMKIFVHQIFIEGERLLTRNIFKYEKETQTWKIIGRVEADAKT
jgi:uncharacterized protein YtpQ (UPF0354 family)